MISDTEDSIAMTVLLKAIIDRVVEEPRSVSVRAKGADSQVILEVRVAARDMENLIGQHGRTARSLRTILLAASMKRRQHFVLEIIDGGPESGLV